MTGIAHDLRAPLRAINAFARLGREVSQRGANIPVLLTSGYADAASGRAESEGFGVLRKPYSLAELAALIKSIRG